MKDCNSFSIGKVLISATNPVEAEKEITKVALQGVNDYVCVSNVYTVVQANKHDDYLSVMKNAYMCLPDGIPLIWMARVWGMKDVLRTPGPDLFVKMLKNPDNGIKHFLLGDTEGTLSEIQEKYPDSHIVGVYSPPFAPIEEYDIKSMADKINRSGANIVWISLKAPKQDFLSQKLMPYLKNKLCIGVGAGFRFAIGEYKHPSRIAQKLALTGFFWRKNKLKVFAYYCYMLVLLGKWSLQILLERCLKS